MALLYSIFVALFSSIGAFLFGYDSGVIATVITMPPYLNRFGSNPNLIGAVTSCLNGGCFFGAAAAGYLNDKLGRKRSIQIGSVFSLWGSAMQCGASNFATLLVGRVIGGFAIGFLSMTVPLYNSEVAPAKHRGFMVGLTQQMIGIGFIVSNWVGYGCQNIPSDASWRIPLGLQMVPAFCLLVGIQFLPNSPRWLLEVDRDEEAREVIYSLDDAHKSPENLERAELDYQQIYDTIKAEKIVRKHNISALWETRAMLRRTLVACGVQIFGQFTGINVINYYGPRMYESLGISAHNTVLVQGIYGAIGPIANLFFIIFILDRVGRKKPLLYGAASFVCTFSILASIVATNPPVPDGAVDNTTNHHAQLAGIAMIFLTSINFSLSFGPVSWVLAAEVFPTATRSIGTSVATMCNWAFNTLLSQVSPLAMANITWKYYIVFVCLNAVDLLLIFFFFPETKGKSLEDMNEVFGDQVDNHRILGHEHAKGDVKEHDFKESITP